MNRHALIVLLLWLLLAVVGEFLVVRLAPGMFPVVAAEEGEIVDNAFTFLMILAVPVLAFVLATLLYSLASFRSRGTPSQDGPPIHTNRPVLFVWFLATIGLTALMIVHPGITGMRELADRADREPDLVVKVETMRFGWRITYPEQKINTFQELVLPVGKHVRFEVTSLDVLHAFWVPAFRMKIDAVPGMVTTVHATPNRTGGFQNDPNFRLQCAELCGIGHSVMQVPVRVVEQKEFDAWAAQQSKLARRSN
ncbi:MAG: cytochrome c oxidase subunit II [Chloroflexi bacterium]|nr:cytochrome c oxidase subunit II [Chloroflexota bacterium]